MRKKYWTASECARNTNHAEINPMPDNNELLILAAYLFIAEIPPMPRSHLMTDWICIATEGETVDGRKLEAQWLTDMADTYDAEGVYTAMLWPEHERWWGSCGEVLDLKTEQRDGLTKLYARLCPAQELLYANQRGQLLFCSVEPTPTLNFRGTGKPYLEGLGVTNQPASIGLDRMRFKAETNGAIYGAFEPLVFRDVAEINEDDMSDKTGSPKKSLFRSLFNLSRPEKDEPKTPPPEKSQKKSFNRKMQFTDEQVASLADVVEELLEESEEQAEIIDEIKTAIEEVREAVEEIKEEVSGEEFSRIKKQLTDAEAKFSKLDQFTTQLPDNNPGDKGSRKYAF